MDPSDNLISNAGQRDFWDSLQLDILAANQKLTDEDYSAFTERNFMFSLFFRGCSVIETIGFQQLLGLKDNGYLILLELYDTNKQNNIDLISDELMFHQYLKKNLPDHHAIGPLISNRLNILITRDNGVTDLLHKEESMTICRKLVTALEENFPIIVKACIGSVYNIHSIYSSFIDALACLYYSKAEQIIYYPDLYRADSADHSNYVLAEKHLVEAVRLRKIEAYDYFGMIIDFIRNLSDEVKRNRILEILILANHSLRLDTEEDLKKIDYINLAQKLMRLDKNQLIEFAYQEFLYITSYVKPQNNIDYTNHIVMATKEYMENHYTDDISLENMAEYVNISPQYFSKLIKKTTGFNFTDWLSMLRVKKAKELLTNSNLTVKEVCFMVGYKDPNYFSRIFKKRIGITPSEYVKANSFLSNKN